MPFPPFTSRSAVGPARLRTDRVLIAAAAAILGIAIADITWLRSLSRVDYALSDLGARIVAPHVPADPAIVVVDIDEDSLARLASSLGRFPWPRYVYGELIDELARQGAQAVVLDIELYEPDRMRPTDDLVLNEAVARTRNAFFPLRLLESLDDADGVLLAEVAPALNLDAGAAARPGARWPIELPRVLDPAAWSRTGFVNFLADDDGVGRRYWIERDVRGYRVPSLPARVAHALGWPATRGQRVADPPGRAITIRWPAGAAAHRHVAFADVYEDLQRSNRSRPADEFRDRVVVVGSSATHLRDFRATPISPLHSGVEILATAIDNLKQGAELAEAPRAASAALAVGLVVPMLASLNRRRNVVRIFWTLSLVSVAVVALATLARAATGTVIYVGVPLAAAWILFLVAALRAYLAEQRAKEAREQVLSRFLDPRVVRRLVADGVRVEDFRSETRNVTVLFSDIRGFTALSESRSAEDTVDLLNRYLSVQAETVFRHGGTLDKFIGDAIMAFWNAPTDDIHHPENAVACALDMVDTVERFNATLAADGIRLAIGVGVHTGSAVVGFVGSARKIEYTAIGDTVNVASRVEGATKGRSPILISEATRAMIGDRFVFRDIGDVAVKGRAQTVRLYAVEGKK